MLVGINYYIFFHFLFCQQNFLPLFPPARFSVPRPNVRYLAALILASVSGSAINIIKIPCFARTSSVSASASSDCCTGYHTG